MNHVTDSAIARGVHKISLKMQEMSASVFDQ